MSPHNERPDRDDPDIPVCICGHGEGWHRDNENEPPEVCWAFRDTDVNRYCPCYQWEPTRIAPAAGGPAGAEE